MRGNGSGGYTALIRGEFFPRDGIGRVRLERLGVIVETHNACARPEERFRASEESVTVG